MKKIEFELKLKSVKQTFHHHRNHRRDITPSVAESVSLNKPNIVSYIGPMLIQSVIKHTQVIYTHQSVY